MPHRTFFLTSFLFLAWTAAAIGAEAAKVEPAKKVPGVVIDHVPASSGLYVGSPSIAVLPGGAYVASHDFFGPKSNEFQSARTAVFGSSDRGHSWKKLSEVQGAFWSSLFVHRGALYLLGPDRHHGNILIRRSTDGGATWNPVGVNTGFFKGFATSPVNPNRMYVAISSEPDACLRSDDGGATWTGVGPAGCSGYGIWMDPADPDRVFVTVAVDGVAGVYRTTDGGANWTRVLDGTSYAPVAEFDGALFAAVIGQGTYRSVDNGDTWTLHASGIVANFWQASATSAVAPLFGHWGGLYRWDPARAGWVVSQTGLNNAYVRTVSFYHDTGVLWAATDQSGLWRSFDLGATWEIVTAGLPTWTIHDVVPPDHHRYTNPRMALATDYGMFISDDAGDTWTAAGQQGQVVTDAGIDFDDPDRLWAGLSTGGLRRSTDGGVSWLPCAGIPNQLYPDIELADGPSGTRVLASFQELMGGSPAVYYSDDGGANFTAGGVGLTGVTNIPSVGARRGLPGAGGMVYCSTNTGIFRSLDGGATWEHAGTLTGLCWSVFGALDQHVYAGRQGQGTWASEDEGLTWTQLATGLEGGTVWAYIHGSSSNWTFAATRGRGVKQIQLSVESAPEGASAHAGVALGQPNPFRETTTVRFQAPAAGDVTLRVFNASGRPVAVETRRVAAGAQELTWTGRSDGGARVPGGVYYFRLEGAGVAASGRWVLVR